MATTDTTGTCASCLSTVRLMTTGKPVRHGFSIVGAVAGHGLNGTWHTGPCMGAAYLHLGLSVAGAEAVLARAKADLEVVITSQAMLATVRAEGHSVNVMISKSWRMAKVEPRTFVIAAGAASAYDGDYKVPSWETIVAEREAFARRQADELLRMITLFTEVVATWAAAKYPVAQISAKGPVIHKSARWGKSARGSEGMQVALCQQWAFHPSASLLNADASVVTCTRCLKAIETAKRDAAKRAAKSEAATA